MLRWCLTLAAYTYTIEYKPGKVNCNADALSRLPLNECPSVVPNPSEVFLIKSEHAAINSSEVAKLTSKDPILSKIKFWAMNGWPERKVDDKFKDFVSKSNEISVHKDCLLWGSKVIIPERLRKDILNLLHDTHIGIVGTKALARGLCWWPKMDKDIERMISSCAVCLSCGHDPPKTDVYPWIWPSRPWSRLHIDHAGPFQGKLFLVVVDAYSKWIGAKIVSITSTETTINSLKEIFATHGLPDVIVSDNGTPFTLELFKTFLKRNGVRHILCAPYHAASNGQVERAIQTLKNLLRKNSSGNWTTRLYRSLLSMRIAINSTTQKSPAQLLMNRNLKSLINKFHPGSVSEGRMRQEDRFIRNWKPHRVVNEGQAVIARGYHGPRWLPGVVQEKTGPVSIKVETDDGDILNRHLDQVRGCGESEALPSRSSTPQVTPEFERPPAIQETDSSEGTPKPLLRRSLRIRKPPSTFHLGITTEPVKVDRMPEDSSVQRMTEVRDKYVADALTNMQPHCEDRVSHLKDAMRGLAAPRTEEVIIAPIDIYCATNIFLHRLEQADKNHREILTLPHRRDLGYSKNNSGSDNERTLGPQEAFCPLGSQTFNTRSKGCKEKVIFRQLALFEANPEEFVSRFVTMDETWAHHFTPESKQQSMQWRHSGSPPPKKAKTVPSAGKVMVSVFWDSEGVLLLDFLNKGQTITGNYYANLVKQLQEAIKEKRRGKLSRKIVYHQDNAPSHRSLQTMAAIYDSGFELLPYAPYSPDLALSDFHLFPHLKNHFLAFILGKIKKSLML
ncbi:K02A2.6-like [Cordylochernes scorpioides]|uniref:RNA-directed DNA polymerase n=1 Tax=Cordylochernes scorpioides TaxID=51811 RepID=A0ABY6LNQ6_9ARAC|nr:K02A2.6-like [Cordylochernes scorpioides]